jgi:hypothetical protein
MTAELTNKRITVGHMNKRMREREREREREGEISG